MTLDPLENEEETEDKKKKKTRLQEESQEEDEEDSIEEFQQQFNSFGTAATDEKSGQCTPSEKAKSVKEKVASPAEKTVKPTTVETSKPSSGARTPKTGGKKDKGAAPSKKGRPPQFSLLLRTGLKELKTADISTAKSFTDAFKSVARNWAGYLSEIEKAIEDEEGILDQKAIKELEILQKQGKAANIFLITANKHGLQSKKALQCYDEEVASLQRPPAAATPFPHDLQITMHWPTQLRCGQH